MLLRAGGIVGQLTVGGGQQVRLADAESAVQIQPDARQQLASTEQLLAPAATFDGALAEVSAGGRRWPTGSARPGRGDNSQTWRRRTSVAASAGRRESFGRDGRLPKDSFVQTHSARPASTPALGYSVVQPSKPRACRRSSGCTPRGTHCNGTPHPAAGRN